MNIKSIIKPTIVVVSLLLIITVSAIAYAVSGVWTEKDNTFLSLSDSTMKFTGIKATSGDGYTFAVATNLNNSDVAMNGKREVLIYTDTDKDGKFSDETAVQVITVFDPKEVGDYGGYIEGLDLNTSGTRLTLFGEITHTDSNTGICTDYHDTAYCNYVAQGLWQNSVGRCSASEDDCGKFVRVYELTPPTPTNQAPTVSSTLYFDNSGTQTTTAQTGDKIGTFISFSEEINTPTVKSGYGGDSGETTFSFITSGMPDSGECKMNPSELNLLCVETVNNAGLYKVYVTSYADKAGKSGVAQTYSTNSNGVTVTVAPAPAPTPVSWNQTILFTGSKTTTQAITVANAIADGTGLTTETASFGGTLIKTLKAGQMRINTHLEMNAGNTHELYYKDGSAPTHSTDGTRVNGGNPDHWNRNYNKPTTGEKVYVTKQDWGTHQNVPVNRYYWIRSSMDVNYHGASEYQVRYTY